MDEIVGLYPPEVVRPPKLDINELVGESPNPSSAEKIESAAAKPQLPFSPANSEFPPFNV
jgi:hypothetical protein